MTISPHFAILSRLPPALRGPLLQFLTRDMDLDAETLRGRRVLILGSASCLAEDLHALDSAGYDLLVRFNNGLDTPMPLRGHDPLHCDLLFHSLTDDARPVTPAKLERAGVRCIVHRTATRSALLNTLTEARRLQGCAMARIPLERYRALSHRLGGASPSSGLVAVSVMLEMPVAELAIAGFTFFSTRYVAGYDDAVDTDEAARRRIAAAGHHDPAAEAAVLAEDVAAAVSRGLKVTLGSNVLQAIARVSGRETDSLLACAPRSGSEPQVRNSDPGAESSAPMTPSGTILGAPADD
ncbi:hypothetical protein Q4511_03950 [Paracoccus sp. 1_MG-2023]|uniref:hypothetical protein n=1 Tax=unclassified Paracoccus (in: a-proteobacteria) TaxID=2688777 RepID=UPI001C081FC8|nr:MULTISPECIES: hypothetical protein [unclassified Paracoccus (in: a-proteobacteria)]MBU2956867.1 hypothetical protein [Paracoccus sp. C2R09]MDO6668065.1 hypothetical protein [Paracoccus sp. 1_MG-2023]